ncbi:Small-conductance mechanosensitive channel [plant metagenome]|uniref:Small-conductance mechanosensitive channel n=1 Tax=plant metagenome TaxID=1297885 RepID=A0A484SIM0_9ZZZZ
MDELLKDVNAWTPLAIAWGSNLLAAIIILIVGWWVSAAVGRAVGKAASRSPRIDPTIVPMVRSVAVWAIRIFTLIAVLARFGVQTASLIAVLGAAGLAIGLALQGTLQNISAGIMLLALRPLRAGEYIAIGSSQEGTVQEVGLFLTRLTQADGINISLPNSTVWNATIINYSRHVRRRLDVASVVRYGDDIDLAINTLKALVAKHPLVLQDPAPAVLVTEYRDNGVVVVARVWAEASKHWELTCSLRYEVRKALESAGMRAPVPVRGVEDEEASSGAAKAPAQSGDLTS